MSDDLEDKPLDEAATGTVKLEQPVDNKPHRLRRTFFVFVTVFVSYVTCVLFGVYGTGKLAEMVVDGLISLMMMTTLTYITAYSIDSSEILKRLGERKGRSTDV